MRHRLHDYHVQCCSRARTRSERTLPQKVGVSPTCPSCRSLNAIPHGEPFYAVRRESSHFEIIFHGHGKRAAGCLLLPSSILPRPRSSLLPRPHPPHLSPFTLGHLSPSRASRCAEDGGLRAFQLRRARAARRQVKAPAYTRYGKLSVFISIAQRPAAGWTYPPPP
jgi:hypothetical protein